MPYSTEFNEFAQHRMIENIAVIQAMQADSVFIKTLRDVAQEMSRVMAAGQKLLLFGNGGSAADAQHIAAELVGRFKRARRGLPAIVLTANTSTLTAVANDDNFERVFARQVDALGSPGDLAIGLSTSGNLASVLRAIDAAEYGGLLTIGLTGRSGGDLRNRVQYCLQVASDDTPRIQEAHTLLGHILCEWVEDSLLAAGPGKSE